MTQQTYTIRINEQHLDFPFDEPEDALDASLSAIGSDY